MNWITRILGGSIGNLVEKVGNVVDKFHLSGEEKQQFKVELEALLQRRDSEIEATMRSQLQAKERILVAELTQGDKYTKRARPTVVYAGLAFIFLNYCLIPLLVKIFGTSATTIQLDLPVGFWAGWSGIVATWSIGRTAEKRGSRDSFTRAITGSSHPSLFDDEIVRDLERGTR